MTKQKIILPELFGEVVSSFLQTHPTEVPVFAATGDDQLTMCRFDWEKNDAVVIEQTGLLETIGCVNFNADGSRINCSTRSAFFSMDSEMPTKAVDKRVFPDPITSIAAFTVSNQSYNLILGDENGNIHLIDSREATTVKDRLFKSRTEGVQIVSVAVDDKIVYAASENGVVEAFDLKKRGFIRDYEFAEKMLTHIFVDDKTPVVSTDEGEVLWLDLQKERVMYKAKESELIIERVEPISNDFALVKSMGGEKLMLLSTVDHKFLSVASDDPAVDVASTSDSQQVVVGFEKDGHVHVEVWSTSEFLKNYGTASSRARSSANGHNIGNNATNNFYEGLDDDDDF